MFNWIVLQNVEVELVQQKKKRREYLLLKYLILMFFVFINTIYGIYGPISSISKTNEIAIAQITI